MFIRSGRNFVSLAHVTHVTFEDEKAILHVPDQHPREIVIPEDVAALRSELEEHCINPPPPPPPPQVAAPTAELQPEQ